jgi:hypothetical protein
VAADHPPGTSAETKAVGAAQAFAQDASSTVIPRGLLSFRAATVDVIPKNSDVVELTGQLYKAAERVREPHLLDGPAVDLEEAR